jgi:beta-lactam-binding protein with PASTA domain
VPDVIGKTVAEAEKIIEESNLEIQINNETEDIDKENAIVTNQLPQGGIKAYNGSCVYVDLGLPTGPTSVFSK